MSRYRRSRLGEDPATPEWLTAAMTGAGVGVPSGPTVTAASAATSATSSAKASQPAKKTPKPKEPSKAERFNAHPAAIPSASTSLAAELQASSVKRWLLIGGAGLSALGLVWLLFLRPRSRR